MIALDASLVIAHLGAQEPRHDEATALLADLAGEQIWMSTVNVAEVLVGYARGGRLDQGAAALATIGVEERPLPGDAAPRLAELRASTGLKLPDCCVLLTAESAGAAVASFDRRLRGAAERRGIVVMP
ncbi:hypothetical protein GCM10027062_28160 [Nocardioides hungaricus]